MQFRFTVLFKKSSHSKRARWHFRYEILTAASQLLRAWRSCHFNTIAQRQLSQSGLWHSETNQYSLTFAARCGVARGRTAAGTTQSRVSGDPGPGVTISSWEGPHKGSGERGGEMLCGGFHLPRSMSGMGPVRINNTRMHLHTHARTHTHTHTHTHTRIHTLTHTNINATVDNGLLTGENNEMQSSRTE